MPSITQELAVKGLIRPPGFLPSNVMYETIMGSMAYGVSSDSSDWDVYGFCIPPKDAIFPHLAGEIPGFGKERPRFEQFQRAHIRDASAGGGKGVEYDLSIYGIVKYFSLCMENNPNMIDSLFTPQDCVIHITRVGNMVRERRQWFLHKGAWPKFKGYAYSQLRKTRTREPIGKRKETIETFGFDVKYAYHLVRLLDECEQILVEGDIDLRRNREQLKAIRRGDLSLQEIERWAAEKELQLERAYHETSLPDAPDEERLKQLLLDCLEDHYGSLEAAVVQIDPTVRALRDIRDVIERVRGFIQ